MIPDIREKYNTGFNQSGYDKFIDDIQKSTGGLLDFKICETPLFIDKSFNEKLISACDEIIGQLTLPEFTQHSANSVPVGLHVPYESDHPLFLQIDFGIVRQDGDFIPQLIELQGFPSLYAYQSFLDEMVRKHLWIPEGFDTFYNDLDHKKYSELLSSVILNDHDPNEVILLEIDPWNQKTKIDFFLTAQMTGISVIDLLDVKKERDKLFYEKNGKKIRIKRVYNRVIFDELSRKEISPNFNFTDDLDIEWAGHPNWFFKVSKHTLPYLKSIYSPESFFLDKINLKEIQVSDFVLKPLYSFAGSGVNIDPDIDTLLSIKDKKNYILQKKVSYEPVIETPDGFSKAEIRMMFIWKDKPTLVNNLLRTSKGKMMGVDFNKGKTWIGSNIVYHP